MLCKGNKIKNLTKLFRQFSQLQKQQQTSDVVKSDRLQFSKARLVDFGELPLGQIPDALQVDRPHKLNKLSNGVRVASESIGSNLATVTVLIKSGSRNENLNTSGVSQFIKRLVLRGTSSKTREQVEQELDNLGGNINIEVGREVTTFSMTVNSEDLSRSVDFLGDILNNSLFNKNQIEVEKDFIYRQAAENHRDQMSQTLESAFATTYRDHFIGQSIFGIRENISQIQQEDIKKFIDANWIAPNFVISAAGNVNHEELLKASEKNFGKLASTSKTQSENLEKPYMTPSTMYMRDDEMANINVAVCLKAPSWNDPDYFAMHVFLKLMGEYTADKYTGAHLNSPLRQYNQMHRELGNMPDITIHKSFYYPFSDTAIFGNYLFGNEVFGNQMLYLSQGILTEYAATINQAEVFRSKNAVYNEILQKENSFDIAKEQAYQVLYLNRRIPRSEFASRISAMSGAHLSRVATKWFWDTDVSLVAWGPVGHIMAFSHYNRPIKRSTLGWYGSVQQTIF